MNHPVFTGAQFAPDPFCVIFWLKWSQLRVLFVVCQLALAKAVGIADKMYNGCDLIWCDVRCLCIIRPLDRQASNKKWEGDSTQFDIQTCNYICSDICNYPISTKTYPYKSIYIYNYIVRIHVFSGCNRIHTGNWYLGCSPLVFSGGSQPVTAICCFQ